MPKFALFVFVLALTLAACAPVPKETAPLDIEAEAQLARTPFPMENGLFTGAPGDFVLQPGELGSAYAAADAGSETPNSAILDARPDGQEYLAATGRQSGWRVQYDRISPDSTEIPLYVVNSVNMYDSAEGAALTLSREWHNDVWSLIDSGQLTELAQIDGLDADHLVWQTADGAVGIEIVYRNLYLLFTSPAGGGDTYAFLADIARAHLAWIQAGEQ